MLPLYLARIEDLRHGDLVKVDCAACQHVAALTPEFLLRARAQPAELDLKERVRCRGCGAKGRAGVWVKWCQQSACASLTDPGSRFTGLRQPADDEDRAQTSERSSIAC
jgi:hypothetical protein